MSGIEIGVTIGSLAAIAALAYFFFGPKKSRQAEVRGNVQEIRITVKGGYSPDVIRVREGVPLRLVFAQNLRLFFARRDPRDPFLIPHQRSRIHTPPQGTLHPAVRTLHPVVLTYGPGEKQLSTVRALNRE